MNEDHIFIFARLDSSRLPGKVLLPVGQRPLLGQLLDRVRELRGRLEATVATSTRALDDPVAAFATAEGVNVFRGESDDVATRALKCAQSMGTRRFIRISADSPFIDIAIIDAVLRRHEDGVDLATNVYPRTFPRGMSVEVVSTSSLARCVALSNAREDREHVTRYMYEHPELFSIANHRSSVAFEPGLSVAVDTEPDLRRARWIARQLGPRVTTAGLLEIAALASDWNRGLR